MASGFLSWQVFLLLRRVILTPAAPAVIVFSKQEAAIWHALGYSIFTERRTLDELRRNVKEATDCNS